MPILMPQPIPEKFRAMCVFCHRELDVRDHGIYQYTSGWVMNRAGGGGHGVSLPDRQPRWSCGSCIDQHIRGTFGQPTMW